MRILVVKMSSMGDLIHTLPALTDAQQAIPDLIVDWLVEDTFQEIPRWHPAVDKVIPVKLRAWRKKIVASIRSGEITACLKDLRSNYYDVVIDAQGLLKSAFLAKLTRNKQVGGFSFKSVREAAASLFYRKHAVVAQTEHAISRNRVLFAHILGYQLPTTATDYGVVWHKFLQQPDPQAVHSEQSKPYLMFLHGTTWQTKHWPDVYWQQLAALAGEYGFEIRMTWATNEQKLRVQGLAAKNAAIKILPHLSLNEAVVELLGAKGAVAVDTGFGHLAAAIGIPAVSLYGPTDPKQIGTLGHKQLQMQATLPCTPCLERTCIFKLERVAPFAPCMLALNPRLVWEKIMGCICQKS